MHSAPRQDSRTQEVLNCCLAVPSRKHGDRVQGIGGLQDDRHGIRVQGVGDPQDASDPMLKCHPTDAEDLSDTYVNKNAGIFLKK